jgi:hypothetical protein
MSKQSKQKKRRRGHAFLLKQQKNMLDNHKKKE